MLRVNVAGLEKADTGLRQFVATVTDLRPFWRELGEHLADTAQSRWPLRRRSGRLRESLVWQGGKIGRRGVFEASPAQLTFGTSVFYGRFHQHGARNVPRRVLIHVDAADANTRLSEWTKSRARAAGLEVE